jgi:REP element-mobilizing transposase RayT
MSHWKIVEGTNIYFLTTTIIEWSSVFTSIPMFDIMIESLKYCIHEKGIHLHGYVIMLNHAHYIVSAEPATRISEIMRDYNRYTSRRITNLLQEGNHDTPLKVFRAAAVEDGRSNLYKVWQEVLHPVGIETEAIFREKLGYIHQNPVRKGFVEQPEQWKYSSAKNYCKDDHSIIQVECLV